MQNRYVGDIGDFAKYALLRSICGTDLRLGIIWCLFADESHNADGRHTGYLQRSEFRSLDPELYDLLTLIVKSRRRSVHEIAQANIFPSDTKYFDSVTSALPNRIGLNCATREAYRTNWFSAALVTTATCDLVFCDPDNGLETSSVPRHAPKAGKYIYWDELKQFWMRGQSLVVYHHLNRSAPVRVQTEVLRKRFITNFPDAALLKFLLFRRGSCRHFWIVGQKQHAPDLQSKIEAMLDSGWAGYFEIG
jgi:hypothetical protein